MMMRAMTHTGRVTPSTTFVDSDRELEAGLAVAEAVRMVEDAVVCNEDLKAAMRVEVLKGTGLEEVVKEAAVERKDDALSVDKM